MAQRLTPLTCHPVSTCVPYLRTTAGHCLVERATGTGCWCSAQGGDVQLSELTDHMLKGARQAKESWVREVKGAEGMTDLPWTVHFRRGAEPIAMVYFNGNRDTMFGIARMGTIGFEADVLGVMNESYHSTSDTNPLTGDPWAPGEMQVLAEQHDGLANGWVREALTLLACNRAGDVKTMWLPYAIKGRAVEW